MKHNSAPQGLATVMETLPTAVRPTSSSTVTARSVAPVLHPPALSLLELALLLALGASATLWYAQLHYA
jgi:hypothetical protein